MNLVERVKGILLQPNSEWSAIASEPGNAGYLFPNYVAIVAAIPPVCSFIGMALPSDGSFFSPKSCFAGTVFSLTCSFVEGLGGGRGAGAAVAGVCARAVCAVSAKNPPATRHGKTNGIAVRGNIVPVSSSLSGRPNTNTASGKKTDGASALRRPLSTRR